MKNLKKKWLHYIFLKIVIKKIDYTKYFGTFWKKSITLDILEHLKNKSITLDILENFEKCSWCFGILFSWKTFILPKMALRLAKKVEEMVMQWFLVVFDSEINLCSDFLLFGKSVFFKKLLYYLKWPSGSKLFNNFKSQILK